LMKNLKRKKRQGFLDSSTFRFYCKEILRWNLTQILGERRKARRSGCLRFCPNHIRPTPRIWYGFIDSESLSKASLESPFFECLISHVCGRVQTTWRRLDHEGVVAHFISCHMAESMYDFTHVLNPSP
jgi:hypothetical protein